MKALTDKIAERLFRELIIFGENVGTDITEAYNNGLKKAMNVIMEEEDKAEFEEIARVMMKHLGKRTDLYCPHHTVIITNSTAELVQGQKSVGQVMDYVPD